MKTLYILPFLILSIWVFSCSNRLEKKSPINYDSSNIKTIYIPNDLDTVRTEKGISMYNEDYVLRIIKYCLNDSSLSRNIKEHNDTGMVVSKAKEVYHNYVAIVKLYKGGELITENSISKDIFKDSLNQDFYKDAYLKDIKYNFVRSNKLYFTVYLNNREEWTQTIKLDIDYLKKKGLLRFCCIEEI